MANYVLFKNWVRVVIFQKIATLVFAKFDSFKFGFAVVYNLAQNSSYRSSDSIQTRIYVYKLHEILSKLAILLQDSVFS